MLTRLRIDGPKGITKAELEQTITDLEIANIDQDMAITDLEIAVSDLQC